MSEITPIETVELTREQAVLAIKMYQQDTVRPRHLLLLMFDGKAHKQFGFGDFDAFCSDVLGIDGNVWRDLRWARVERELLGIGFGVGGLSPENLTLSQIPAGEKLTQRYALELAKLDSPDDRRRVHYEMQGIAKQSPSESQLLKNLRIRVEGIRKQKSLPAPSPSKVTTDTTPAPEKPAPAPSAFDRDVETRTVPVQPTAPTPTPTPSKPVEVLTGLSEDFTQEERDGIEEAIGNLLAWWINDEVDADSETISKTLKGVSEAYEWLRQQ